MECIWKCCPLISVCLYAHQIVKRFYKQVCFLVELRRWSQLDDWQPSRWPQHAYMWLWRSARQLVNSFAVSYAPHSPRDRQTIESIASKIVKFMGQTLGPPGSCWPQMGPMLALWTLLSGISCHSGCLEITTYIAVVRLYVLLVSTPT